MTDDRHPYAVAVRWTHGKAGTLFSVDELTELKVAAPPQFGGPPGEWSPEHLFVASVVSCFMTTFVAIARNSKLQFIDFECDGVGMLERGDDRRYRISEVVLRPVVRVPEGSNLERVDRILQKAEAACLISRSINSSVRLEPSIELESAVA